jgi:hypothetical protein
MEERERDELIRDLMDALERRSVPDATWLLDLLRVERTLMDSLAIVRREIDAIIRSAKVPTEDP